MLHDKQETRKFMLRMLYLDTVTQIKNNLYVLDSIHEGEEQQAVHHLERILGTKLSILEGCRNDLCSEEMPKDVQEAVALVEQYQENHGVGER